MPSQQLPNRIMNNGEPNDENTNLSDPVTPIKSNHANDYDYILTPEATSTPTKSTKSAKKLREKLEALRVIESLSTSPAVLPTPTSKLPSTPPSRKLTIVAKQPQAPRTLTKKIVNTGPGELDQNPYETPTKDTPSPANTSTLSYPLSTPSKKKITPASQNAPRKQSSSLVLESSPVFNTRVGALLMQTLPKSMEEPSSSEYDISLLDFTASEGDIDTPDTGAIHATANDRFTTNLENTEIPKDLSNSRRRRAILNHMNLTQHPEIDMTKSWSNEEWEEVYKCYGEEWLTEQMYAEAAKTDEGSADGVPLNAPGFSSSCMIVSSENHGADGSIVSHGDSGAINFPIGSVKADKSGDLIIFSSSSSDTSMEDPLMHEESYFVEDDFIDASQTTQHKIPESPTILLVPKGVDFQEVKVDGVEDLNP